MRKRVFKDRQLAKAYDNALLLERDMRVGPLSEYFAKGYDNPDRPSPCVKGSIAYAYWAAGVDKGRANKSVELTRAERAARAAKRSDERREEQAEVMADRVIRAQRYAARRAT